MQETVAIVVTLNRKQLLEKCIHSLLRQESVKCDILIVDNNSTDGTESMVRSINDPKVGYFNTGSNLGGAGGFNYGIKKAMEQRYTRFWLMDDDTIPNQDALHQLSLADSRLNGSFGWLSSLVLWKDGTGCRMNQQKIIGSIFDKAELLHYGLIPALQATFVSLYIARETVELVGLPIKDYFIWGDDIEYTRRVAIRKNIESYLVFHSLVKHEMNNNTGSNIAIDVDDRIERYYYAYRNDFYTYRLEGLNGIVYYTAKCGKNILRILFKSRNHRFKRLRILFLGAFSGAFFKPKIEYSNDNRRTVCD